MTPPPPSVEAGRGRGPPAHRAQRQRARVPGRVHGAPGRAAVPEPRARGTRCALPPELVASQAQSQGRPRARGAPVVLRRHDARAATGSCCATPRITAASARAKPSRFVIEALDLPGLRARGARRRPRSSRSRATRRRSSRRRRSRHRSPTISCSRSRTADRRLRHLPAQVPLRARRAGPARHRSRVRCTASRSTTRSSVYHQHRMKRSARSPPTT